MRRSIIYLLLGVLTIMIGLASRLPVITEWLGYWMGDLLYATMFFWFVSMVFPKQGRVFRWALAFTFCLIIELQQNSNASIFISLRKHPLGALVFGQGFSFSDIILYFFGSILGVILDRYFPFLKDTDS